jgi:allophanate hydrolase
MTANLDAIQSPVLTPSQRVAQAYATIEVANRPEVWIHLRPEADALADATEIEQRLAHGEFLPLAGLVVAVKDNIDVLGLPTTAAHPAFSHLPERSATAVERLISAGAVVLGKTNLDQFATGLVGTRSPFGAVRNSIDEELISGGSSSGSAVAVALDIVDFALGTDTAGSGRVPAALNNLVGIKPTLGLVPVDGVVPACRSYDTVTVFAKTLDLATLATRVMIGYSALDGRSRVWPSDTKLAAPSLPKIAIPAPKYLTSLDNERLALFYAQVALAKSLGWTVEAIEFAPFLECAKLLYEGALVAERYAAYGEFLEQYPDGADPTVSKIALGAKNRTGPALVADQGRVADYKLKTLALLDGFDALLIPTAPEHPTLAAVAADPIAVNSRMGTFTNFMNLLDMCGVAIPAGEASRGLFGVTIVGRAFEDQVVLDLASRLSGVPAPALNTDTLDLAVFGAHMKGLPLNHQLQAIGARFVGDVSTSNSYRMFALDSVPPKPGVVWAGAGAGVSLAGELWQVSPAGMGKFLAGLPQPMTLGSVELSDGRQVVGFGCAAPNGPDVSEFGGWRAYLASH